MEFGLGNGRSYDHLRERLPGRDIHVFDRQVAAHPDCIPPAHLLWLGDFRETAPAAVARFAGQVALIHGDVGSGDDAASQALSAELAPYWAALLQDEGILVSDQPVGDPSFTPAGAAAGGRSGALLPRSGEIDDDRDVVRGLLPAACLAQDLRVRSPPVPAPASPRHGRGGGRGRKPPSRRRDSSTSYRASRCGGMTLRTASTHLAGALQAAELLHLDGRVADHLQQLLVRPDVAFPAVRC